MPSSSGRVLPGLPSIGWIVRCEIPARQILRFPGFAELQRGVCGWIYESGNHVRHPGYDRWTWILSAPKWMWTSVRPWFWSAGESKEWTEDQLEHPGVKGMLQSFRWIRCCYTYKENQALYFLQSLRHSTAFKHIAHFTVWFNLTSWISQKHPTWHRRSKLRRCWTCWEQSAKQWHWNGRMQHLAKAKHWRTCWQNVLVTTIALQHGAVIDWTLKRNSWFTTCHFGQTVFVFVPVGYQIW